MKTIFKSLIILSIALFAGCDKEEATLNPPDPLIGYWVNPEYEVRQITLKKADDFNEQGYGIAFFGDGTVIERSGGWCGTPPITYSNLEGNWTLSDSMINIFIPHHWMGDIQWEIVSLEEDELIVIWE